MPRSAYKPSRAAAAKAAEPKVSYGGAKQRLNVTVRADLIERARAAKLNLSSVIEESLELLGGWAGRTRLEALDLSGNTWTPRAIASSSSAPSSP